jgi:hypothetical protein
MVHFTDVEVPEPRKPRDEPDEGEHPHTALMQAMEVTPLRMPDGLNVCTFKVQLLDFNLRNFEDTPRCGPSSSSS